jgi:putative aminopeptidase FrvX
MDSIGYTVRYDNQLVRIGSPHNKDGDLLVGEDQKGNIECEFKLGKDGELTYDNIRPIETGTTLTYKPDFRETDDFVQCCYLDNRLGIYVALKLAETMENGAICFSCWEEHGGGSAENIGRILYEKYHLRQALICDITWVTEGVKHGKGVAVSIRDSGIPRRSYVNRIIEIAKKHQIPYQLEVEGSGGSDGNSLQRSPYPFDWCFVGAPEDNVHTPNEIVHKNDIKAMIQLYTYLVREL